MKLTYRHGHSLLILFKSLVLSITASSCAKIATSTSTFPDNTALLAQISTEINRQGNPCPQDFCLDDWPNASKLSTLEYWDCKAYAVAKADQLIHQYGYDPSRLEYVLIAGQPLRVTHAALLVDGRWALDNGLRCQICSLEKFANGVEITSRLPVAELPYLQRALRSKIGRNIMMQKD